MREVDYEIKYFLEERLDHINYDKEYNKDTLKEELLYDMIYSLNERDFIWLNNYLSNRNNLGELYIYDTVNNKKFLDKYNKEHDTNYKYAIEDEYGDFYYYDDFEVMYCDYYLDDVVMYTLRDYYPLETDYIVEQYKYNKYDHYNDDDDYEDYDYDDSDYDIMVD